jgi:nucleoside-diphosphate-sugar epimerase
MRVLITGAAGYVGKAVVDVLAHQPHNHHVRLFDRAPAAAVPAHAELLVGDITDFETVTRAVDGMDAIVNLAIAGASETYRTPTLPMRINVEGTTNVLEAARRARIQRIVHMSSGAVVTGYSRDTCIHVELPHKYSGMYGLTKSLQERVCQQYAADYGLTVVALRPWSVSDSRTMTAKSGQPLQYDKGFFGLVCRYDLADACALGLTAPLEGFQPFHIMATDEAEPWFDMERTHHVLGWRPTETFASLKPATTR